MNEDVLTWNRPLPGWEESMRDELDEFFLDPTASASAKDGYLVLRANIHVTMAMTRLRLMQVQSRVSHSGEKIADWVVCIEMICLIRVDHQGRHLGQVSLYQPCSADCRSS